MVTFSVPALVAHLDVRLTGNQEVAGLTHAEVDNILSWRLIWNIFYGHSLLQIQEEQLSVYGERCAQYWLTAKRTKPAQ